MTKILVTGANGQLGSELKALQEKFPSLEFVFTDVENLDITNAAAIEQFVRDTTPQFVINCAAYTAVDRAEEDLEMARKINALAPRLLAEACAKAGMKLIHVSTDYVFDGTAHKPYTEDAPTSPESAYGVTKLEGEQAVTGACRESVIIRTSWLYSSHGNNFVKTMLRLGSERDELGIIFDQIGTPTYARDLADAILTIVNKLVAGECQDCWGIYHFSNEGVCSWYDFAWEIFRQEGIDCKVRPIETAEYPTPAKRPHYSVMHKGKIRSVFGINIPHWADSLSDCLAALKV